MTEITSITTDADADTVTPVPTALPWLVFSNPGELDLRCVSTFGISAKPGTDTPIGYFGTGLKYALAICARLGARAVIHVGEEQFALCVNTIGFRKKDFDVLCLQNAQNAKVLPLPFTTELGKTWEPWMAYRELWANAVDEGGTVTLIDGVEAGQAGETRIYVQCRELYETYLAHGEHFVTGEPICVLPGVNLYPPGPSLLCYHGIRMATAVDGVECAQLTYDLTGQHELTEDRKLADLYQAKKMVAEGLLQCTDRGVLEAVLGAEEGLEAKLDFDWYGTEPSEEFISVALEAVRTKRCKNASVKALLRRIANARLEAALVAPIGETWEEVIANAPGEPEDRQDSSAMSYIWGLEADVKELRAAVGYWRRVAEARWQEVPVAVINGLGELEAETVGRIALRIMTEGRVAGTTDEGGVLIMRKQQGNRLDWTACAPEGGWKEHSYYVVEVQFKPSNPPHRAILCIGFWGRNQPENYSYVFNGSYENGRAPVEELYAVKVIGKIDGIGGDGG